MKALAPAILLGILLSTAGQARAAGLTLSDAVKYAIAHSSTVVAQRAAVASANYSYVKAHAAEYPQPTGSLSNFSQKSNNLQGSFGVIGLSQVNNFSQNTAQLGTSYTLYTSGQNLIAALSARAQLEAQKATLRETQDQLATSVASAFYTVATDDDAVRLDQSDLLYQRTLVKVAQAKERAGVAAGVDVLSAQAAQAKSQSALVLAQAQAVNARETLAQLIGAPLDTAFDVPQTVAQPPLPAQPLNRLVAIAQTNRPEVASAQDALHAARLNRRNLFSDLYPTVALGASFGNQFSPTSAVLEQAQIDAQNAQIRLENQYNAAHGLPLLPLLPNVRRGSPGFWQLQATTTFSLPLFDYGQRHANRSNLDAQISSSQSALDAEESQVALDVRQDYRNAVAAQQAIGFAQTEAAYAKEAARIAELQYAAGLKSFPDVQQAQQASLSAQTDLYTARVNYVNAIVKLRVALGIFDAPGAVADLGDN